MPWETEKVKGVDDVAVGEEDFGGGVDSAGSDGGGAEVGAEHGAEDGGHGVQGGSFGRAGVAGEYGAAESKFSVGDGA